ncbi:translation initiation factor IF-2 [Deferribacterales bacterium Es71-Z0220]|uniref:translation initiation factor IF-2 n=1 Tax=Deferrivibrio essentukiensis TaxID=2880922 RepID=UPI001F6243C4|nr:translation initiation factor IF-2 [Deferrivibrio essentukiensis]MCB4203587.1 translation initiation factor IF-2 [Deferrivibrio essentukiensis]
MSKFKLQEVIEKAGLSFEDALEKLKEINIDVSSPDDMVNEKAVSHLGVDPKILSVDKRQELLKKALERHKRHSRPKEVVIKKSDDDSSKRISKEELLRKKRELEKSLKKVDEEREKIAKVKQEELNKEKEAEETKVEQEKVQTVEVSKAAPESATLATEVAAPVKDEDKKETQKPSQSEKTEDKPKPVHREKKDGRDFNRRPREHSDSRRDTRTPETKQFKDKKVEQKPRREDDSRGKAAFKKQDDIDKPSETFEKLKRVDIDKKKETPKEDIEPKKVKAKKGVKKEKNLVKDILEGFDELELEEAIVKGEIKDEIIIDEEVIVEKTEDIAQKNKGKRQQKPKKKDRAKESKKQEPVKITKVEIGETITVNELAGLLGIKAVELVKKLFAMGVMASVNQAIDAETAQLLGAEYDIEVVVKTITEDDLLPKYEDNPEKMKPRPPIVTVMGHVDHGKTSLLDAIRKTRVAEGEAGGITQHIGAYEVDLNGRSITFLDTPGHEAFTTLRARGANVTDIVILVVAADDGVMPQTKEAIDHSKAAGVRLVVAVNKIDKPNANPEKVKTQLAEYGIIPEEWGGENQFQEISAKNRIGIEDLLERVLLEADMLELKADYDRLAEGIIIESKLDKQRGPVGTVLVRKGTLKNGDFFVVGPTFGKVRAMFNSVGRSVKTAGPSVPVEVMGFSSVPESGQTFIVVPNEKVARQVAEIRMAKMKEAELREKSKVSLNDLFDRIKEGEIQELNIVIKADVQGSVEALKTSLIKLSNQEVKVNIIHDGVGGINESDVLLAAASNAVIIGFNVRPDNNARAVAERENVEINLYSVIYEAIDNIKSAIEGMLSPEVNESVIGRVEVRQVFSVPKIGKIAGAYVLEGKITRNAKVRVIRDNIVVYDGTVGSLKRFQDDAKEVVAGYECGVGIDRFNDIKEGDIFEVYEMVERKRELKELK